MKKLILILLVILVFSLPFAAAETCQVSQIKQNLRKALYEYLNSPGSAQLELNQIKDLLFFYLSISQGQSTVNCDGVGQYSGEVFSSIIQDANNINIIIPACSDAVELEETELGDCSLSLPKYCYNGNLINKCNICGCSSGSCLADGSCSTEPTSQPVQNDRPVQDQTCNNECVYDQLSCSGNYAKVCGNYDEDLCLEWNSGTFCTNGCTLGVCAISLCESGICDNLGIEYLPVGNSPEDLTLRLLALSKVYGSATGSRKAMVLSKLSEISDSRKQKLLSLIEENPAAFLKVAIPKHKKEFPLELTNYLEEEVSFEGSLEVLHSDDFDQELSKFHYFLNDAAGNKFSLHFVGDGPMLLTGSKIRVKGIKLADKIALENTGEDNVQVLYSEPTGHTIKKVAVILFNFQNNPVQPYTAAYAKEVTFGAVNSANAYYQEVSFDKLSLAGKNDLSGDVFGWYTIPYNNSGCLYSTWASAAKSAAQAAGVDLNGYDEHIFAFPRTSSCGWAGLGSIGGSPARAWINGGYSLRVVAHEQGHNWGVHHASSYSCYENGVRVPISSSCTRSEYGDPFDIMGSSTKHMNNFMKGRLNWYNPENTLTVNIPGTYTIAPIEQASSGIQALRIPRDIGSTGQVTNYYYLEYRQPFGFDNFLSTSPVVNGISIRLAPPYTTLRQSWLIDTTPSTSSFTDAALLAGKTFTDSSKAITITTTDVSTTSANVNIGFGSTPCTHANPSISVSPLTQWAYAGQTLSYNIKITNNDNSACTASTFEIKPTLPAEFLQNHALLSKAIVPGASANFTVDITSDVAAYGYYNFTETVVNSEATIYTASASAYYNIHASDVTPPTITITTPGNGYQIPSQGNLLISASASDQSGIKEMNIFLGSKIVKHCLRDTCSGRVAVKKIPAGTHIITITANDNAPIPNTGSASIQVVKS